MYRSPPEVPPPSQGTLELDAYEQQLRRTKRRKKLVIGGIIGTFGLVAMSAFLGPCVPVVGEMWTHRQTKLTKAEAKEVNDALDPVEAQAKASQAAFAALWPKLRAGEVGARKDLGPCRVAIPGPNIRTNDSSVSLSDSSQDDSWTFVDLTPATSRSPLANLDMPRGSIALSNGPNPERMVLTPRPLRVAPSESAPVLESTRAGEKSDELRREAVNTISNDGHQAFLKRVHAFANEGLGVDVVVFLDLWEDPKFVGGDPSAREQLRALEQGTKPTRVFRGGLAIARAFAWSPEKRALVCASQALAQSSSDITFKSNNLSPLRQDLVFQLEKSLQRSFVAAGDAPPRIERPADR